MASVRAVPQLMDPLPVLQDRPISAAIRARMSALSGTFCRLTMVPYSQDDRRKEKEMLVKITAKRQVTFPAHVLDAMGARPGDYLR